jgi:hypothetical protein
VFVVIYTALNMLLTATDEPAADTAVANA